MRAACTQSLYWGREQRLLVSFTWSPPLLWGHSARNPVDWAIVGLGNVPNFRISDREGWMGRAGRLDARWSVSGAGCPRLHAVYSDTLSEQGQTDEAAAPRTRPPPSGKDPNQTPTRV